MAKAQTKKAASKSTQNDNRPIGMSKITEEDENKSREADEEINSGFGSYLRSSEGMLENVHYIEIHILKYRQKTIYVRLAFGASTK